MNKAATIEAFDPVSGKGVIRLDEDRGAVPVHFAADVCRGVVPTAGARVVVGDLGPEPGSGGPFSDTFAFRAGLVEADVGAGKRVITTIGITEAREGADWNGDPVLRVPFDAGSFPGLGSAFREDILQALTFGMPEPASFDELPAYLQPLASLCAVSRRVPRYRVAGGKPPVGSTFVGGDGADIGDVPWPTGADGPMSPILQIGLGDARKIGLDDQINVFFDAANDSDPHGSSMVPASLRQQVPRPSSPYHVVACKPGARITTSSAMEAATRLALIDEVSVFPDVIAVQSAYAALGQPLPLDVRRFWDLEIAKSSKRRKDEYESIQRRIGKWFPDTSDLDGDVILGGFSALHVAEGPLFKRLATFSTARFGWLEDLVEDWDRAALEVSFAGPVARAWLHGVG